MESTYNKIKANQVFLWFAFIFSLIHISGDHIFNKTNTLKLAILLIGLSIFSVYLLIKKKKLSCKYALLLSAPLISTIPGLLIGQGQYNYNFYYEACTLILCSIWAFFIYQNKAAFTNNNRLIQLFIPITLFVVLIGLMEKLGLSPLIRLRLNPFEASWIEILPPYNGTLNRIESTFGNINYYAAYLIQLIPLFITFSLTAIKQRPYNKKHLHIISLTLLMLISLLFTGTRAALFASLTSIIILFVGLLFIHNKLRLKYLLHLSLILVLSLILIWLIHQDRIEALLNYTAWHSRIIPWQAAINSIIDSPIFGHGLGSSYQLFFEFVSPNGRLALGKYSYNHVHFELLEIAQEGGILGITGYFLLWAYLFISLFKLVKNNNLHRSQRYIALSILCGFIAFHLHGCFSVAPRMISVKVVTYTLIAYSLILISKNNPTSNVSTKTSYLPLGLIITLLFLSSIWLAPFIASQHSYAKALASTAPQPMKVLSQASKDIYILDRSAWMAMEIGDKKWLASILKQANSTFPNYRKLPYLNAYLAYLNGDLTQAKKLALNTQEKDTYLNEVNELLAHIALKEGDKTLFKRQLSIAMKSIFCKTLKQRCDNTTLKVIWGESPHPINVFMNKNEEVFILANDAFEKAHDGNIKTLKQEMRRSPYFQPITINNYNLNDADIDNLYDYLQLSQQLKKQNSNVLEGLPLQKVKTNSLAEEINNYYQKRSLYEKSIKERQVQLKNLENKLKTKLKLEPYLMRRKAYYNIGNWFERVALYDKRISN